MPNKIEIENNTLSKPYYTQNKTTLQNIIKTKLWKKSESLAIYVLSFLGLFLCSIVFAANLKITSGANYLLLRIENYQPIHYKIFALSHPERIVIDLKRSHIQLLPSYNLPYFVKGIRRGYPAPQTVRVVVDLNTSVRMRYFSENENSVCVEIFAQTKSKLNNTDKRTWENNTDKHTSEKNTEKSTSEIVKANTLKSEVVKANTPKSEIIKANSLKSVMPPNKKFIVVIDPGHGGKDPGAIGEYRTQEKYVVLMIAKRLAKLINQQPDMKAILTRNGDYFVSLRQRLRMGRKKGADIFMSIHADSYFNSYANGVSVYTLSSRGASSVAARWIAERENHSELGDLNFNELSDQSHQLRSVLIDLAQTANSMDSNRLGGCLLNAMYYCAPLHYAKVEQAPFMVLKSPDIPSVLVETGFISNPEEEMRLRNPEYQHKLASALFAGIQQFKRSAR